MKSKGRMRDGLIQRADGSWTIVLTVGRVTDPKTGRSRPTQKWVTVKGTREQAKLKKAELLSQLKTGQYVEPTKMTVGEWLDKWLEKYVSNSTKKRPRTREAYKLVVKKHLIPALGHVSLQNLRAGDIQDYYNESALSPGTLEQHHAILHQALKVAVRNERLITVNPAELVPEKPNAPTNLEMRVWSEDEVRRFLAVAAAQGVRSHAFYATAIETGMRKGELCGLKWEDVDLDARRISVRRTLIKPGHEPVLGAPKNGRGRAITVSPELAGLLRRHREAQGKNKLETGASYTDLGFVFAKVTGEPLQMNNLGQREFAQLIKKAGVRSIRFHDLRHTCATLLLARGEHPKVVQERLGHTDISITLNRYSHVTPTMQENAARTLGGMILSGGSD